jgi:hypothetical protein
MSENDAIAVGIVAFVFMACLVAWAVHSSPEIIETKVDEPALPPPPELPAEKASETSFTSTQVLGALLAIIGFFGIIIGLGMDITHTGDIVNLGLMNDRIVLMIAGGFGLLTGTLLIALTGKK